MRDTKEWAWLLKLANHGMEAFNRSTDISQCTAVALCEAVLGLAEKLDRMERNSQKEG